MKPAPVIAEARDAAQFYANRVIKDFKDKLFISVSLRGSLHGLTIYCRDVKHVEWARSFMALLEELRKYVLEFHTTGLSWNPKVCFRAAYPNSHRLIQIV
jgi:adenylyl cyclase-associated protein